MNSCQKPAEWLRFNFVQTNSNGMTSMWFMCLIPSGPKTISVTKQIPLRAFPAKHVIWFRMPFCCGMRSQHFANNAVITNDINKNIQYHDSEKMKIVCMHIQEWTTFTLSVSHWIRCQVVYNARVNKLHRYRIFDCDMLLFVIYFIWIRLYIDAIICKWLFLVILRVMRVYCMLELVIQGIPFAVLSFQWRNMNVMVSQITVSCDVCSTCSG